ncbi:MerR family transcriptional regulator [Streptomyces sp. NPDC049099]|uniref:MerR family transcriptional regulator n=1 Tax=Streptomyces sp. NPDC049099 TaxID=3155768 RepID=UPI00342CEF61
MGLLTIGAFAKASRLSPKALRLYDDLGLLPPARVAPVTGYRLYAPGQPGRARLVAWLRRLGMPLARIQHVCTLEPGPAAQEIRAFWAHVEADIAARRDLAAFLIDHLTRKEPSMAETAQPLGIRYAALSDRGLVRESNQDTAYAGSRLLALSHPERSLLARALGQGPDDTPDMSLHDARHGDRYLLCSDGLSTVVPAEGIHRVLSDRTEPEQAVRDLVALAHGSRDPDNVSCVVADVLEFQQ